MWSGVGEWLLAVAGVHNGINSTNLISVEVATFIGGLTYTLLLTYYQSSVVTALLAKDSRPPLTPRQILESDYKVVSDEFGYYKDVFQVPGCTPPAPPPPPPQPHTENSKQRIWGNLTQK